MIARTLICLLLAGLPVKAIAQESYPSGTVRLIVGFAPGGGNDILARIMAEKLQEAFGKPFIVENRPGASGVIAVDAVKRAAPDGLTLLVGPSSAMTVNPVILKSISYDPVKDFAPIAMVGVFPLIVAANPSLPANTLAELIALAKVEPGKINYSSAATSFQIVTEYFAQRAGIKIQNIAYKGSAPAVLGVVAGEVSLTFGDIAAVLPQVQGGKLKALAVSTQKRVPSLPEVPTIAQSGVPGFNIALWSALFAPAGTPPEIVKKLEAEVMRIVALPDVQARMKGLGVEPAGTPGAGLPKLIADEIAMFRKVAETSGIQPE
ncbi:MAG: tripartite tricarboxylate transporter substrate binding protein [Pseudorhodoplanes sp.]